MPRNSEKQENGQTYKFTKAVSSEDAVFWGLEIRCVRYID